MRMVSYAVLLGCGHWTYRVAPRTASEIGVGQCGMCGQTGPARLVRTRQDRPRPVMAARRSRVRALYGQRRGHGR